MYIAVRIKVKFVPVKRMKAVYNFRCEEMKTLGYVSLVNCYDKHERVFSEMNGGHK